MKDKGSVYSAVPPEERLSEEGNFVVAKDGEDFAYCLCIDDQKAVAQALNRAPLFERLREVLDKVIEALPFGIESESTVEVTVHDRSGGLGTMGPNMTNVLKQEIKTAKALLSDLQAAEEARRA